ncbi:hypothetical protein K402DRAFT_119936 [Aulographum hederae CBS 113979]|uniref:Uncharacterized protein n=1 Tax=Aulographum hederae CBS 113979 TaxID=1176131 RepID=A0A6G1GV77_9PEZI|nr:hypothetical protein K402DRAFT_119936 [Aulographum hederae CBS 113979]
MDWRRRRGVVFITNLYYLTALSHLHITKVDSSVILTSHPSPHSFSKLPFPSPRRLSLNISLLKSSSSSSKPQAQATAQQQQPQTPQTPQSPRTLAYGGKGAFRRGRALRARPRPRLQGRGVGGWRRALRRGRRRRARLVARGKLVALGIGPRRSDPRARCLGGGGLTYLLVCMCVCLCVYVYMCVLWLF